MLQTRKTAVNPAAAVGSSRPHVIRLDFDSRHRPPQEAAFGSKECVRYPGEHKRWSPRATLALGGGVSLLLWGVIGLAIYTFR
jgi:hypothetical protein